jgi:hypothetical protein
MAALLLQYNDGGRCYKQTALGVKPTGRELNIVNGGTVGATEIGGPNIVEIAYTLEEYIRRTGT